MEDLFKEWEQDPEFKALELTSKANVYLNYFDREMVDKEFGALSNDEQRRIKTNFIHAQGVDLGAIGEPEEKHYLDISTEPYKKAYREIKEKVLSDVKESLEPQEKERKKGPGFLGTLERPDGDISTELSIGIDIDGEETEIPSLIPTLTKEEINHLLEGNEPTEQIVNKAVEHAEKRIAEGKSPFAQSEETDELQKEETAEDIFTSFITKQQKEPPELPDYKAPPAFTPEREMELARKYPNLMAARFAVISILPMGELLASPTYEKEFHELPENEQALRLTGELAAWAIMPPAIGWLMKTGAKAVVSKFPWMAKPILKALKEATWFRRMTNKERGLVVETISDMKNAGLNDAQILKNLRNRNSAEYKSYFQEAVRKRATGEVPPITPEAPPEPSKPIIPPAKPVEPSPPRAKVKMMIVEPEKGQLRELGYTDEQIAKMKPDEATTIIEEGKLPTEEPPRIIKRDEITPEDIADIQTGKAKLEEEPEITPVEEAAKPPVEEKPEEVVSPIVEPEKPPKAEIAVEKGKEAWEMTKIEFSDWYETQFQKEYGKSLPTSEIATPIREHEFRVKEAFKEGKPIPDEVLADYPELKVGEEVVEKAVPEIPEGWKVQERFGGFDIIRPDGVHWGRRHTKEKAIKYAQAAAKKWEEAEPPKKPAIPKAKKPITITDKAAKQKYLVPWIAKSGGIHDVELAGEVRDIIYTMDRKGRKKLAKGIMPGFIRKKGRTLDVVVVDAREAGFDVRDIDHLLELIQRDLAATAPEERVTKITPLTEAAKEDKLWEDYLKEAEEDGISEREAKEALERESTDEIAKENEFARLEREAIQNEVRTTAEEVSFKPEEIEPTEPRRIFNEIKSLQEQNQNTKRLAAKRGYGWGDTALETRRNQIAKLESELRELGYEYHERAFAKPPELRKIAEEVKPAKKPTKILTLNLKKEYWDAIKSGEKTSEYRLDNDFWRKRLKDKEYDEIHLKLGYPKKGETEKTIVLPWKGYELTTITHKHFGPEPVRVFALDVSKKPTQPSLIKEPIPKPKLTPIEELEAKVTGLEKEAYEVAAKRTDPWAKEFQEAYQFEVKARQGEIRDLQAQIKELAEKRIAEAPKTESLFSTATSLADTGGYATLKHHIIEMPEIVELANQLLGGKYPSIKRKLSRRIALGLFKSMGMGKIELKAEIFKNSDEAAAILAHEIGHLVDWLPERTLARGNILGRIASLKRYMKHTLARGPKIPGELTEQDRQRLRNEATKLAHAENKNKYIDEVIRKELPILPEDVLRIWNAIEDARLINKDLYDYIATISTIEKKAIIKDALKGQLPAQLKQFAKVIEEKTGKKIKVEFYEEKIVNGKKVKVPTKEFKAIIKKKYLDLINKEIKKRRLFQLNEVMDEVKILSREWKPFDPSADPEYTKYRYSGKELYADTISAIINAPGLVRAKAPLFYEGFFNYMERKPEVKRLYDEIQNNIKSGEVEKQRTEGIYEMFQHGDDAYALSLKRDVKISDLLKRDFIDVNHFILKKIKEIGEANIPAGENPRYKLENMNYTGSETEWYLTNVLRNTIKPLEKVNLSWNDLGFDLFLRRVATERAEIANPRGWTPELAKKKLVEIKESRTPKENEAMDEAVKGFRDIHNYVTEKAIKAERWSDELIKIMEDAEEYATFDVVKYIEKRHGIGPAAKIYQQIGTLNEVSNPATATILKDIAIMKATNRGIAAQSVTDFLQKNFPADITTADTKWNGKFHEIKDPPHGSRKGLIVYLRKGKPQGFYVDKYIAGAFEKNPVEGQIIARILGATAQPFRMAFVELNYGFWVFNAFFRDYQRAAKMLPKASMVKFLPTYLKGIKPAFKSVFGIPDPVIGEMQKGNMLISIADVHGLRAEDKQIERMLRMYHIKPPLWNNRIIKPFAVFFNWFTNVGRALERTTKVASYKYLKKKFPSMDSETMAHIVRTRGGSPDFLRRGSWYPVYNNFILFSNAVKEGYRGDYEAFSESPAEFIWKQAKYTYIPKLLMYAGGIGILGYGVRAIYDGASEYDKTNYMLIPLGITETGKSVYFRIPTDETSRIMGGIFWKVLNHKEIGWGDLTTGLFDYMAGQAPTIHPGIDIMTDIIQYASGRNPYDAFRGRYALPEDIFEAGGERSHKEFLRYLANKSGANMVYRFQGDRVEEIQSELEKITRFPFLSNLVGRFIKVSNYGIKEELRKAKAEARKDNTQTLLDAKDALLKIANEEKLTDKDIEAITAKPDIIERNLVILLARKHGLVYLDEYIRAGTEAEKIAVLRVLLEKENFKNRENLEKETPKAVNE